MAAVRGDRLTETKEKCHERPQSDVCLLARCGRGWARGARLSPLRAAKPAGLEDRRARIFGRDHQGQGHRYRSRQEPLEFSSPRPVACRIRGDFMASGVEVSLE